MEDKANGIIKPLVVTECMVATLVCNDPNAGKDATLDSPVGRPGQERERARKVMEVMGGNVIEEEGYGEVINYIRERTDHRALKTVRWNGLLDLAETEGRFLKRYPLQSVSLWLPVGRRNRGSATSPHLHATCHNITVHFFFVTTLL